MNNIVEIKNELKDIVNDKRLKLIIVSSFVVAFLCYFEFLRINHGNADWLNEGYLIYSNWHWHLSLGRWMVRFVNMLTLNAVYPLFNVVFCTLCQAFSALLITRLWNIDDRMMACMVAAAIVSAPAVASQYLYIHVAMTFGVALLLSTVAAYLTLSIKNPLSYALSVLSIACCLGCYQSYIGFTAGLIILTLIIEVLRGFDLLTVMKNTFSSLLIGIAGCSLYLVIWKVFQRLYGIDTAGYSGADQIGVTNSISKLTVSLRNAYLDFFSYYFDSIGKRHVTFALVLFLILIMLTVIWLKREDKAIRLPVILAFVVLLPIAFNFVELIAPDRNISNIMNHQMQLVVPFALALVAMVDNKMTNVMLKSVLIVTICALSLICMVRSFATYKTVDLSYRYVDTVTRNVLFEIQKRDDYSSDRKIVFAGFPSEIKTQEANPLYRLSYQRGSAVFWTDLDCIKIWHQYILTSFGFDTGEVYPEEYDYVTNLDEFYNMPCYPEKGYIEKIDGLYVVKFTDYPIPIFK